MHWLPLHRNTYRKCTRLYYQSTTSITTLKSFPELAQPSCGLQHHSRLQRRKNWTIWTHRRWQKARLRMIHSKFKCEFRDCVCRPHAFCLGLWQTHSPSCSSRVEFYNANQPRSNAGVDSVYENKTSPSSRLPPGHVPRKVFPSLAFRSPV